MDSSLIGKVAKARRYAEEKNRVVFNEFSLRFHGDHRSYEMTFRDGTWDCTCEYFPGHGTCSHTMALERILEGMLPVASRPAMAAAT